MAMLNNQMVSILYLAYLYVFKSWIHVNSFDTIWNCGCILVTEAVWSNIAVGIRCFDYSDFNRQHEFIDRLGVSRLRQTIRWHNGNISMVLSGNMSGVRSMTETHTSENISYDGPEKRQVNPPRWSAASTIQMVIRYQGKVCEVILNHDFTEALQPAGSTSSNRQSAESHRKWHKIRTGQWISTTKAIWVQCDSLGCNHGKFHCRNSYSDQWKPAITYSLIVEYLIEIHSPETTWDCIWNCLLGNPNLCLIKSPLFPIWSPRHTSNILIYFYEHGLELEVDVMVPF